MARLNFDQINFPCGISMTAPSYMNDLKTFYMKDVIVPKRSNEDIIDDLQKSFTIEIIELSKLDDLAYSTLKNEYFNTLETETIIIWKLIRNSSSEIFYKAFYKNYHKDILIYLIFEKNFKKFFSNCSLLQSYITICQGVDQIDIMNETSSFRGYLNTLYLYHQCLYELNKEKIE